MRDSANELRRRVRAGERDAFAELYDDATVVVVLLLRRGGEPAFVRG
ncbi:hypothetical protein [Streptomyces sp. NPDC023327]